MSNDNLRVGLAIAVCIGGFVAVAAISWAITTVLFDRNGYLRRPQRRSEPWGSR